MTRKYKFEITLKATAFCTVEAESPEAARDYFNQIDWKVKLDGVGPFDSIVDWQQSEFEAPNITLVDSEIHEGEEVYYCPSFCKWDGDDKFYCNDIMAGGRIIVNKYGRIIGKYDPIFQVSLQRMLDKNEEQLYCRRCFREAKKNVY